MRHLRNLAILVIFLSIGFMIGIRFGGGDTANSIQNTALARPPINSQVNLLLVGVDHFDEKPILKSVWLLIYLPNNPALTFVPLYPGTLNLATAENAKLAQSFRLAEDGAPSQEFFSQLQDQSHTFWNGYLITDDIGVLTIIDYFGGVTIENQPLQGVAALDYLESLSGKPEADLQAQTAMLRGLCEAAIKKKPDDDFSMITNLNPTHLKTNLNLLQMLGEFKSLLLNHKPLHCKFP